MTHGGGWVPAVTHVNPKYTHATVPRLLEGTTYEFRVSAENLQGRSEPLTTDQSIVARNQFGKFFSLSSNIYNANHKCLLVISKFITLYIYIYITTIPILFLLYFY